MDPEDHTSKHMNSPAVLMEGVGEAWRRAEAEASGKDEVGEAEEDGEVWVGGEDKGKTAVPFSCKAPTRHSFRCSIGCKRSGISPQPHSHKLNY